MRQLTDDRRDSWWTVMGELERAFETAKPMTQAFTPAVDVHETGEFYLVSMDLPGVNEKDILVDTKPGRLTVRGERKFHRDAGQPSFRRLERHHGKFERAFALPQDVNFEGIQARFENGVLEVLVPKKEAVKARSIELNKEKGGLFSTQLVNSASSSSDSH